MHWDLQTDVVVVGFGVAGAAAALEARAGGASVIAVDRYAGGGASTISGGVVYAGGGTSIQREAGVVDSTDEMFAYLSAEVGDAVSTQTLRRFCETSPAMIAWLEGHGVPFEASLCPYKTSYPSNKHYLYYSGSEAAARFRGVAVPAPRGHRAKGKGTSGKMLYGPMKRSAVRRGVQLIPQTRALDLVMDGDRVVGVECLSLHRAPRRIQLLHRRLGLLSAKPGIYVPQFRYLLERRLSAIENRYATPLRIGAASVILTAGGFIANREMMKEHAPTYTGGIALGTAGDDGSGIVMGRRAGGATAKLGNVSAWRFIVPPTPLPGSLLVDAAGKRMVDESRYGAAIGHAIVEGGGQGWLLADAALLREARAVLPEQSMWFQRVQNAGLMLTAKRGNTIDEVAAEVGIDPAGLRATVDEHNSASVDPQGKHPDFVRPVSEAPFTLLDVDIPAASAATTMMNPCPMITLGGLVVDEETGGVKSEAGETIAGLYAAGRTAVGLCSNSYVSGLSLADCVFSGRRAGAAVTRSGAADGS